MERMRMDVTGIERHPWNEARIRASWDPLARVLLAYESGDTDAVVLVVDDLGDSDSLPANWFFREELAFPPLERRALELCAGRVLDLGAGAGCHSLVLQERGHPVCAVELLPELVQLLRRRGVADARTGSVFDPPDGQWNTVLMLMNGWGLPETLTGLDRFLLQAHRLVAPGGRIIADSTDMRSLAVDWRSEAGTMLALRADGRYVGEIQFQMEYAGVRGDPFSQLYVDPDTLSSMARRAGWEAEITDDGENGAFLSVLRRSGEGVDSVVPSDARTTRG